MIVITVAFFVTQVYSRIYTTHDGNLMIAFIILGSFLCGKEYGIITGVILSIFVLFMRYNSYLEVLTYKIDVILLKDMLKQRKVN